MVNKKRVADTNMWMFTRQGQNYRRPLQGRPQPMTGLHSHTAHTVVHPCTRRLILPWTVLLWPATFFTCTRKCGSFHLYTLYCTHFLFLLAAFSLSSFSRFSPPFSFSLTSFVSFSQITSPHFCSHSPTSFSPTHALSLCSVIPHLEICSHLT